MKVFKKTHDFQIWHEKLPKNSKIGFVPTMGFLHDGHLSLVKEARAKNDFVVVSIFVNPIQFNNKEDLQNYPRNEEKDLQMLEENNVDIVFMPSVEEMYPEPAKETYSFPHIDQIMEGALRPGHFNGVAVVVSRLFKIVKPTNAYFGKKDYQQFLLIKELVKECHFDIEIVGMPIVREKDGLAMSSRNARLSAEERKTAPIIYSVLKEAKQLLEDFDVEEVCEKCSAMLSENEKIKLEYFIIADAETLKPLKSKKDALHANAFVALWLGNIRLIDNIELF